MALALTRPQLITPDAYLAEEAVATEKSEYFRGEIYRIANKYFHKGADGRWILTEFKSIRERLRIDTIDMELPLERIYERVAWEDSDNA